MSSFRDIPIRSDPKVPRDIVFLMRGNLPIAAVNIRTGAIATSTYTTSRTQTLYRSVKKGRKP